MKFTNAIAIILSVAATIAAADPAPAPVAAFASSDGPTAASDSRALRHGRACAATSCKVPKGTAQGQYCGKTGDPACSGHVFECNTTGTCCDYGPRDSCKKCGKLSCP